MYLQKLIINNTIITQHSADVILIIHKPRRFLEIQTSYGPKGVNKCQFSDRENQIVMKMKRPEQVITIEKPKKV